MEVLERRKSTTVGIKQKSNKNFEKFQLKIWTEHKHLSLFPKWQWRIQLSIKKTETKRMGEDMKLIGIIKILEGRKWPRNNWFRKQRNLTAHRQQCHQYKARSLHWKAVLDSGQTALIQLFCLLPSCWATWADASPLHASFAYLMGILLVLTSQA